MTLLLLLLFLMRTISADNEKLLTAEGGKPAVFLRLLAKDVGGTFRDLTTYPGENMVLGATWNEDIDSGGYDAQIRLRRQVEALSLSPLQEDSPLNRGFSPTNSYAALLDLNREVKLEWSMCPQDGAPSAWTKGFHGYIYNVKFGNEVIVLECSDQRRKAIKAFIERERVYAFAQGVNATKGAFVWQKNTAYSVGDLVIPTKGKANLHFYRCSTAGTSGASEVLWHTDGTTTTQGTAVFDDMGANASTSAGTPVETVMQQILNDHLSSPPTLYTPSSPGWNIRWFQQQRQSVWEALQALAEQIGWEVRWKWDNGTSDFRLTFWSPDRSKTTADRSWSSTDQPVRVSEVELDEKGIRNAICVKYSDSQVPDADGNPTRKSYTAINATSITNFDRLYMETEEDKNSNIDTGTEAQTFADNMCSDLSLPKATHTAEHPFFPFVELGDLYQYPGNDRTYSAAQKFAPVSIRHEVSSEKGRAITTLTGRGTVCGGYGKWLKRDVRAKPGGKHADVMAGSGLTVNLSPSVGGTVARVSSTEPKFAPPSAYEFHVGTSSSFTPSAATVVAAGSQREVTADHLIPGATYYAKVVPIYWNASRIVRGEPTEPVQFTAGRGAAGHLTDEVAWGNLPLNGGFETQTDPNAAPDHWLVNDGTWNTDVFLISDGSGTSGGNYIKILTNTVGQQPGLFTAEFPVNERMQSHVDVWVKMVAGSGNNFGIGFGWWDYAGNFISSTEDTFSLTSLVGSWQKLSITRAPVANANRGRVLVRILAGATGREVHVDHVRFWQEDVWHEVGATNEPAFQNSWVNYDAANYAPAAFRKDASGRVHLKGQIKSGTVPATIFTLPAGYRPPKTIQFPAMSNNAYGLVTVAASGAVSLDIGTSAPPYASINGISFDIF